jgi:hypothetical protein
MQYSIPLRTNKEAQIGATLTAQGGQPTLKLFNGPLPPNCSRPDPPNLLATFLLPAIPLVASNGISSMLGIWQTNASASGLATCFRMYDALMICHIQGYISESWQPSTPYQFGQQINNVSGVYTCVSAGVSASVGSGPAGIGPAIQDGSTQWSYLTGSPDINLISTVISSGALITVTSLSITAGNA